MDYGWFESLYFLEPLLSARHALGIDLKGVCYDKLDAIKGVEAECARPLVKLMIGVLEWLLRIISPRQ